MTLCAFRVESARKGAISKAQRSFCERRRQVRDETSTRTQLERWPGFGHRWSRLQRPSTSHSYVTHLVVRSNPRTKASASVPSLAALRQPNCSVNQSINTRPRTTAAAIRLLQQLLLLLTAGCAATARGFPRPATHLARRITAAPRRQGAIVGTRDSEAPRATPSHNCIRDHADAKHNKIPAWFQGRGGSAACRATTEAAAHHRIASA